MTPIHRDTAMTRNFFRSAVIPAICIFLPGLLAYGILTGIVHADGVNRWEKADQETVRLAPAGLTHLPDVVVRELGKRSCSIPQMWDGDKPHNGISGEFKKPGQTDWAVLCSIRRRSVILVFWNGSADKVEVVPSSDSADRNWLQGIGGNRVGFGRAIGAVGKDYIIDHYRAYGGPAPPPIDHAGINDAFVEKASIVYYWYEGKWLQLQGAD